MAKKITEYDNSSITMLKGADRVRKRPAVIFGSDGLEGCEHSVFEILSNAVDEAREGYGDRINVTVFRSGVVSIEDFGRGVPLVITKKKANITGSSFIASFTRAVNMIITRVTARIINIRSA